MREDQLHYIWKNRLFSKLVLNGTPVEVLALGEHNHTDGPDFIGAKLRWDSITWVGMVELHLKSSDWYAHNHHRDSRYDAVILHIVLEGDSPVRDSSGRIIPTARLSVDKDILDTLNKLTLSRESLRCAPEISLLSEPVVHSLLESLLIERWESKVYKLTLQGESDYAHQLFYRLLLRYLGALRNNDVMEQVAQSLPYTILRKHADNRIALEAMLLGQAGIIQETPRDDYEAQLLREYSFYRQKFDLRPIAPGQFRKLRVRPATHPSRMLGIAATLLHHPDELMDALLSLSLERMSTILSLPPSDYWCRHFDFARESSRRLGGVGKETLTSLIINAALPTLYLYLRHIGKESEANRTIELLRSLPPENNHITQLFASIGITAKDAAESQALLHLYRNYCTPYRCLSCPVAPKIFQHLSEHD